MKSKLSAKIKIDNLLWWYLNGKIKNGSRKTNVRASRKIQNSKR